MDETEEQGSAVKNDTCVRGKNISHTGADGFLVFAKSNRKLPVLRIKPF